MDGNRDLLLMSAARLYSLGVDLEGAREELRRLVANGLPCESPEVIAAYGAFKRIEALWQALETEHLNLKKSFRH
ncbi:MAG: hypothetical protein AAGU32_12750 [Bacillota bacterium]